MKLASMEGKISKCFINLLLCLLATLPLAAQQNYYNQGKDTRPVATKKEKKKPQVTYPLYNGISIGTDLWGAGNKLLGSNTFSGEIIADVDLKHRYFPTIEIGYGANDEWNDTGIHYKTGAPYFRIGADYNALYGKKHGHMLLVGFRYGFTSFNYDIESMGINDPIYGGVSGDPNLVDNIWGGSLPYRHEGMKGRMQWLEVCLGLRARIWKQLYMGWGVRVRFRLAATTGQYGDPWYVPGFGKYNSRSTGICYTITYKLPY